jgi:hypothetical protein
LLLTQSTQSLAAWGSPHHSEPPMRGADARWAEPALEALRRPLLSCSSTHVAVRERENELRSRDATVWTAMAPSAATCHASEAAVNAWTRDGSISMHEPIIAPWLNYFLTRTEVTSVNLSQNARQKNQSAWVARMSDLLVLERATTQGGAAVAGEQQLRGGAQRAPDDERRLAPDHCPGPAQALPARAGGGAAQAARADSSLSR